MLTAITLVSTQVNSHASVSRALCIAACWAAVYLGNNCGSAATPQWVCMRLMMDVWLVVPKNS
jgi:hypothetical protein